MMTERVGDRKNGRMLLDRPKPTEGSRANGRRRRRRRSIRPNIRRLPLYPIWIFTKINSENFCPSLAKFTA
jgi:hypothetical protein